MSTELTRRQRQLLGLVLALGVAIRLVIAARSTGTNDAELWRLFAYNIQERGLAQTYRDAVIFNHPPLMGWASWLSLELAPYALSVIPLSSPSDRAVLPDGAGAMILVYDLELPNPLPVERLALLYRLTPAEARVCDTIFRHGSVDATAEELCLTRNTVRSHLKSIYSKFGVASQGQLMQRLANSLRLGEGIDRNRGAR